MVENAPALMEVIQLSVLAIVGCVKKENIFGLDRVKKLDGIN